MTIATIFIAIGVALVTYQVGLVVKYATKCNKRPAHHIDARTSSAWRSSSTLSEDTRRRCAEHTYVCTPHSRDVA